MVCCLINYKACSMNEDTFYFNYCILLIVICTIFKNCHKEFVLDAMYNLEVFTNYEIWPWC